MEQKPVYYDGSGKLPFTAKETPKEVFKLTDEARKLISGNPYKGK
jgi:hypothetical protein